VIATDRWMPEHPCARQACPEAVLPDMALYLPTFGHFLIVNRISLSLSPSPDILILAPVSLLARRGLSECHDTIVQSGRRVSSSTAPASLAPAAVFC